LYTLKIFKSASSLTFSSCNFTSNSVGSGMGALTDSVVSSESGGFPFELVAVVDQNLDFCDL
jgi:hypothetical protein